MNNEKKKKTETHLYVVSYSKNADPNKIRRLTELGYSHNVTLDKLLSHPFLIL